jgi:uncharacterized membrane protein
MKNKLIRTLGYSSVLCVSLEIMRIEWSSGIAYVFLVWNLFLAWIPFLLALLLAGAVEKKAPKYFLVLLFCCWLLFFPNSAYILTDLFHLHQKKGIPLWFDLVLLLFFGWNGLLLGFASLSEIQRFLLQYFRPFVVSIFVTFLMMLCGFGIYLGRYPRWNSWDILSNPLALSGDILDMLLHPAQNTRMVGVTFFFSLFLIVAYRTLTELARNFKTETHGQEKI